MTRSEKTLSPEVRALLECEREIQPAPAAVRARAIARARAALAAGVVTAPVPVRPAARTRWAAGVVLAFVASAAVGATAYEIRARMRPAPSARPPAEVVAPVDVSAVPAMPKTGVASVRAEAPEAKLETPVATARLRPSPADAMRAELRLLRRARAAVAREDFAAAMLPIAEHARRFKNGRLVEEREALRVKALAGLGRTDEARRAAASFQARFPHSVLSPAVNRMPVSPP
jgi:hypothetical protein